VDCRTAGAPASSKYNLLYADDAPETEDPDEPADRATRHAREDARRPAPHNQATGT
jgi:hypothetical protein